MTWFDYLFYWLAANGIVMYFVTILMDKLTPIDKARMVMAEHPYINAFFMFMVGIPVCLYALCVRLKEGQSDE